MQSNGKPSNIKRYTYNHNVIIYKKTKLVFIKLTRVSYTVFDQTER